jgi:hypothetical protein
MVCLKRHGVSSMLRGVCAMLRGIRSVVSRLGVDGVSGSSLVHRHALL